MPTFSRSLEQTLHRALALANERRHEYAVPEHLLLALMDDREAVPAMQLRPSDAEILRQNLLGYIESELEQLVMDRSTDSKPTAGFQRIIQRAVIKVQSQERQEVTGADTLLALFAERETHAAYFLKEQGVQENNVSRYIDRLNNRDNIKYLSETVEPSIARTADSAPSFQPHRGRIRFRQSAAQGRIAERKAAARERCRELQRRCASRANEQPELKLMADRYLKALDALRKDRGAYRLFLIGIELDIFLRTKGDAPVDRDRNPPLDADLLFAARTLIVAHAGLITLFPDARNTAQELERYRELAQGLDAFRERILDPVIDHLAESRGIFDEQTQGLTQEIKAASDLEAAAGGPPSQGTIAIKHGWLRGALASIGQYLLKQIRESAKVARDGAIKAATSELVKHPDALTAAILTFLDKGKDALLVLAHKLPSVFGWLDFLFTMLGK